MISHSTIKMGPTPTLSHSFGSSDLLPWGPTHSETSTSSRQLHEQLLLRPRQDKRGGFNPTRQTYGPMLYVWTLYLPHSVRRALCLPCLTRQILVRLARSVDSLFTLSQGSNSLLKALLALEVLTPSSRQLFAWCTPLFQIPPRG